MKLEELQFMRDTLTIEATGRLADLAALIAGEEGAATLLQGAVLKALNRSMSRDQAIGQVKCWLETLISCEGSPGAFN